MLSSSRRDPLQTNTSAFCMNKLLTSSALLGGIFLTLVNSDSAEAFSLFTSRAAWNAAVADEGLNIDVTDSFTDTVPSSGVTIEFVESGIVSSGAPSGESRIQNRVSPFRYGGGVTAIPTVGQGVFDSITWTMPKSIQAWGADFRSASSTQGLEVRGNFDGTGDEVVNFASEGVNNGFLGVVGSADFNSITFFTTNTGGSPVPEFFGVNDFAGASTEPVPEPLTILSSLVGLSFGLKMERKYRRLKQD